MKFVFLSLLFFALSLGVYSQEIQQFETHLNGSQTLHDAFTSSNQPVQASTSFNSTDPYSIVEAEDFHDQSGVQIVGNGTVQGVSFINNGDFILFESAGFRTGPAFGGILASSASNGGTIEFRTESVDGPLLATVEITNTGSWTQLEIFQFTIVNQELYTSGFGCLGFPDLYLVFSGTGNNLMAIDKFLFFEADVPVEEVTLFNCPGGNVTQGDELYFGGSIFPPCPTVPASLFSVSVGDIGSFAGDYIAETLGEVTVTLTSVSNPEVFDQCTFTVVEPEGPMELTGNEIYGNSEDDDFIEKGCNIFPNPVKNELRVSNPQGSAIRVQLTTLTGTILHQSNDIGDHFIQTDFLEKGVYIVRIFEKESVKQFRVIKE